MKRSSLPGFALWVLAAACGGGDKPASDSGAAAVGDARPIARESSAAPGDSASPCPRTGRWAVCSLEKRLEQAGFVPRKGGEPPQRSGLSVKPQAYTLGRAYLEVFIYPDEAAMKRDLAGLDTTVVAPRGGKNDWGMPPRFIRSENLIAVFLTSNEQQSERLTLAVTAGPPQP